MGEKVGFLQLLRSNASFRTLWLSSLLSWAGDWATVLACVVATGQATGNSPLAIAAVFAVRSFSLAIFSSFGGYLGDRFSRRLMMIMANSISLLALVIAIVFNLLESQTGVYLLLMILVMARAVFDASDFAYIGTICTEDQLITAQALSALGWSLMLGLGCGASGIVIANWGTQVALTLDAISFLIATVIIATLPFGGPYGAEERGRPTLKAAFGEIIDGWRYILQTAFLRRLCFQKAAWSVGGGGQVVLLVIIGNEVGWADPIVGVGLLFLVRGFGSGFGPIAGKPLLDNLALRPYIMGVAVVTCGVFYIGVATIEWGVLTILCIWLAHSASAINWVSVSAALQRRGGNEWLARIAAADHFAICMAMGVSATAAGVMLEYELLSLRETIAATAVVQIAAGCFFLLFISPKEREYLSHS